MRAVVLVAACGLLALPTLAAAQEGAAAAAGAQPAAVQRVSTDAKGQDKRICKPIQVTGSRLGTTSVCKTKKEWDDQAALYRNAIERQQLNPSKVPSQ